MRCVLLLGDTGVKVGCGFIWAACAGAWDDEPLRLVLINPARAGSPSLLEPLFADYEQLRQAMANLSEKPRGFRTPLSLLHWPDALPAGMTSLHAMAQCQEDTALCRALFDRETAHQHVSGELRADAAAGLFAMLTAHADGDLAALLNEAEASLAAGEDVRILLCGAPEESACAAGIPALAHLLQTRLSAQNTHFSLAAALLLPCSGQTDAAVRAALPAMADHLNAAYVLGLSADQRSPEPPSAHLTHWLAVHCARQFFCSETPPVGLFTCRIAPGRLDWSCFGNDAEAYRRAFGGLARSAAAFRIALTPAIRQGLTEPRWLRDRLLKWYTAYFGNTRRMDAMIRQAALTELDSLTRLLDGYLSWLSAVLNSLPPSLRYADEMDEALHEAEENYRHLVETTGQLNALRLNAEASDLQQEKAVHRHDMADTDAERLQRYMQQLDQSRLQLAETQARLDSRIGGAMALKIRQSARDTLQAESDRLHAEAAEAAIRIDRADQVATPEEHHLIASARTKLQRMERYMAQVDAQLSLACENVQQAAKPECRCTPPYMENIAFPQTDLFAADALARITALPTGGADKRQQTQAEDAWGRLTQPVISLTAVLAALDGRSVSAEHPVAALLNDIMRGVS